MYSWWGGQQDFLSACIARFFQNLSAFLGYSGVSLSFELGGFSW